MDESSITSETLRYSDRMSQRLHSSGQTILDTEQCNDWSFNPLQGTGGKFSRFFWFVLVQVPVKKIVNWRFFPPYPRKVGQRDGGASLHLVCVMFRLLSYRHVPSTLGNWQVEQGRISFIGSFFLQECLLFCCPHSRYVLGSIL